MAFGNGKNPQQDYSSPIDKFLELKKGLFSCYNKEKGENEIHTLDNFIILDIGYTVKGAEWDDTLDKYTSRYYSNEIKSYKQKMYLVKMDFMNGKAIQELLVKGYWTEDIKPVLPKGANLHIGLTILDLNDNQVKEVFLSGNNFFKVSQFIKDVEPKDILSMNVDIRYTNGTKDKTGNEELVTEEFVDGLKGSEAVKYQKRYILNISKTGATHDEANKISEISDSLDEYFISKTNSYIDKYEEHKVEELKEDIKTDVVEKKGSKYFTEENDIKQAEEIFGHNPMKDGGAEF